jgi:hypothetical protein
MVQSVSSATPGFFLDVIRIQNTRGGPVTVPVNPSQAVYARLKHVRGVPSQEGGAPLFRLRILDNLIDRLLSYSEGVPQTQQLRNLDNDSIDPLIDRLQNQLRNRLLSVPSSFGGNYPETGMLIDLSA